MQVMQDSDRCVSVTIPYRMAGIVSSWGASSVLLLWRSLLGGPPETMAWGIWFAAIAATLTVVHHLTAHHRLMRQAFDLGVRTGRGDLSAVD